MKRQLVYIALTLSTIFWGISFVMTKQLFLTEPILNQDGGVIILVTLRLILATLIMVPALILLRKWEPIRRGDLKWFLLLSLAEPFTYNLFETSGVQLVSGSLSSIIVATIPVFVPFAMAAFYKEGLRFNHILGVVLSLVGIGVMLIGGNDGIDGSLTGTLCLCGAVLTAIVYTLLLVKVVDRYRPFTITTYQNLIGMIYYLPLMFCTTGTQVLHLSWSPTMLLLIGILGIFCSTIAYMGYNIGVQHLGATRACVFNNAIPVFTMIVALLIGQESPSLPKFLGMVIVITGVVIAQRQSKP